MAFVLDSIDPAKAGFDRHTLDRLCRVIEGHVAEERYPGAQIALARHGALAMFRSFGQARLEPSPMLASERSPSGSAAGRAAAGPCPASPFAFGGARS